MQDATEDTRRALVSEINADTSSRDVLEAEYGQVWDTQQFNEAFEVTGFMAPFVVVKRKSDGVVGSLLFRHSPRYYFSFSKS